MFQAIVVEKITKKYSRFTKFLPDHLAVYEIMWKVWYRQTGHR
jgi:hypothetical protein